MNELNVKIVTLAPMRVASAFGFGREPEMEAWRKLAAWAEPKGLLDASNRDRIFGFDNPSPSPGSPNYGYEFWLTVGPEVEPAGEVEIKNFPGGLYAVTRCQVQGNPGETIPATWKKLIKWSEGSRYKRANHQWLEEQVSIEDIEAGEFILDLYLPVAK